MKNKSLLIALATLFITINGLAQTKTVTDVDGNVYHTVTIGTQTWMVENLCTTRYNDSTAIPNVTGNAAWMGTLTPAYCWYDNDAATNKATYGALYNWHAVNTGKLAPKGWHVATNAEWITLHNYVSANPGTSDSVAKALAAATNWATSTVVGAIGNDLTKNNSTGFSALPGGAQTRDMGVGGFVALGDAGHWWTSSASKLYTTDAIWRCLHHDASWLINGHVQKECGLSVRCILNQAKITITNPAKGETILADAPYSIQWNSSGIDSIKIEYSADDGKTFKTITNSVAANTGSFDWHVPDTLSSKCRLVITNRVDPSKTAVLSNFRIKGYLLTRFKANGDYEKFDPALHAWQFKNDGAVMWPFSWYSQFNYRGIDPYTKKAYPSDFITAPIRAKNSNFVDWPLFARTFNPSVCYKNVSKPTYSPTAMKLWSRYKGEDFLGSCSGFSLSCLLAFDRPDQFRKVYPGVGNFVNIHDRQLNDSLRLVINLLLESQFGRQHMLSLDKEYSSTKVPQAIAKLKSYFLSDSVDHRALSIQAFKGGHSIVPYRLEKNPNYAGQYTLQVYDNNYPSGISTNGKPTAIVLDSVLNTWTYAPANLERNDGWGVYLDDPASTYLSYPLLWDVTKKNSSSATSLGKSSGASAYLNFYNTISSNITITNHAGQSIGFADSGAYNNLGDGMPIVPKNSVYQPPIGYLVPDGAYSIRMSAFTDSLADFSVLNQTAMFNYWRSDAVKNQTDLLVYDGGMGFRNPDAQTKTINLEVINRLADCESDFQILNFAVGTNDSVRLESPDIDRVALVNPGPAKTYDLNIMQACTSLSGEFNYHRITVPANSTHFIVPDLQDLLNHPVKIYVDKGNTGIISDSLLILNQFTGIEKPVNTEIDGKFSLIHVYPNPFKSTTTIKYKVTEPGFVSLKVFDVMGTEVATLVNEKKPLGEYTIDWNASGFGSGFYFCKLHNGNRSEAKKMLLMK